MNFALMTAAVSTGSAPTFGWFTLAVLNAGLAESKQRGRLGWFLLSLLFGPFATLFIVTRGHGRRASY